LKAGILSKLLSLALLTIALSPAFSSLALGKSEYLGEHFELTIISPQNRTYNSNSILLTIGASAGKYSNLPRTTSIRYSVDSGPEQSVYYGKANATPPPYHDILLTNLTDGSHSLFVYEDDVFGDDFALFSMDGNSTVNFTISTATIVSPNPSYTPAVPEIPAWALLLVTVASVFLIAIKVKIRILPRS